MLFITVLVLSLTYNGLCAPTDQLATGLVASESAEVPSSGAPEEAVAETEEDIAITGPPPPIAIQEGEEPANGTEQVDFDFVNLPGYGVIDDANSTANASQFSCYHRRYGYYADVAKQCMMFHLCYPVQEPTTQQVLFQRFSFVCSDNAIFDQQHLVCVDAESLSVPCLEAPSFFGTSNDKLIASLHSQASSYVFATPKDGEATEEVATESSLTETVVAANPNQTARSDAGEDPSAQYGALLDSLFG